ncbi:MAG: ATP-binding protein [Spirochaetales bacterium]|nr:ATP-binding protein [Spirochaetales bacterium]
MTDISKLIELDRMAKKGVQKYQKKRFQYNSIKMDSGQHFTGIVGARGIGKTVILKQLAVQEKNSFYISLDTIEDNLFDIIHRLYREFHIRYFLLDEVHAYRKFEGDLKNLYDFLDIKIIFTSSVALAMFESAYDLSRRIRLITLYPFSYREYLYFKYDEELESLSLEEFYNKSWSLDYFRYSESFKEYLQGGIMPFSLGEPEPLSILKNILEKIIISDLPSISRLRIDELDLIRKTIKFIGKAAVDGINYTSISANVGITKYKAEQYVSLLEKAFILQRLFPKGTNVLKEPKILMNLPYRLLYTDFDSSIGGIREDFVIETLKSNGINPYYLKSTRGAKTPDFLIPFGNRDIIVEVGGKGKGREQFKGIDNIEKMILVHSDAADGIKYPLFMLGFVGG